MKTLGVIMKALLMDALLALGISGVFSLIRMMFRGNVTRGQFVWGSVVIFLLLFLDYIYNWIRTLILMKKDPLFKQMTLQSGISWKEYKRIKK